MSLLQKEIICSQGDKTILTGIPPHENVFIPLNPCHDEQIKMPLPLLIVSQSDHLIPEDDTNSHIELQTVQIQISWLLKTPVDLDLHCLQKAGHMRDQYA